jgi:glycosyltransferase involved in cell wall biosynthesis
MKVSIVTPSFNQADYIEKSILSVLQQSYENIEYIIIDGGSSDGSVEIIKKYQDQLSYWVSERDDGQTHAIKKGFDIATGDIYAWLNADDAYSLDTVSKAVEYLKHNIEVDLIYGNRLAIDENGRILYWKKMLPIGANSIFSSMIVGQESCFWRRSIYKSVGGLDPKVKFSMDYDFFSRIAQKGRFNYVPELWAAFRIHEDSRTMNEYAYLGRREVEIIQKNIWGKTVPSWIWNGASIVIKMYGLLGSLYGNKAIWVEGLISAKRLSVKERLLKSFHKRGLMNNLMKVILRK